MKRKIYLSSAALLAIIAGALTLQAQHSVPVVVATQDVRAGAPLACLTTANRPRATYELGARQLGAWSQLRRWKARLCSGCSCCFRRCRIRGRVVGRNHVRSVSCELAMKTPEWISGGQGGW